MREPVGRTALIAFWAALFIYPATGYTQTSTEAHYCQEALLRPAFSEFFSSTWPEEVRREFLLERFSKAGIDIDAYSMVKNHLSRGEAEQIIAPDFAAVRQQIRAALKAGKKILLLNGSYDLVHAGHAGMVQASLYNFLHTQNLNRDQVYLVVLADSDSLIFNAKKHKWNKYGGKEELPRPLQSHKNIPSSNETLHPRAVDLANLGADLVGITPSPDEFLKISNQLWFQHFLFSTKETEWLQRKTEILADGNFTPDQVAEIHVVFDTAIRMLNALRARKGPDIVTDFENAGPGEALPFWHVSSWQMVLQYSLGLQEYPKNSVHKFLNLRDNEYLHNVSTWSKATGQTVHYIDGTDVFYSTTELLKTFPLRDLVTQKSNTYPQ